MLPGVTTRIPSLGRRGEGWFWLQIAAMAATLVVGIVGPRWSSDLRGILIPLGAVLFVAGTLLQLAGIRALGPSLTPMAMPREGAPLRSEGVYRYMRHPMYGGFLLISIGWSLATSPAALIPSAVHLLILELKSRREEAWLAERHPDFEEYRRRVRWRFLPGLR
jgi:protein-S-isoprenylcysteine O-methyltransferase Ste14